MNLKINGLTIELKRKAIKHLYIRVVPPDGSVQISAPKWMSNIKIERFLLEKLDWIFHQKNKINLMSFQQENQFIDNEVHYFLGKKYLLSIVLNASKSKAYLSQYDKSRLILSIRGQVSVTKKAKILDDLYRQTLKQLIIGFINKYQPIMGVLVNDFGIKKMKTRWGTCNIRTKKIWLNLSLAQKPKILLEYVVVHEMVHLLEQSHNSRFVGFMDKFMPDWRIHKQALNGKWRY